MCLGPAGPHPPLGRLVVLTDRAMSEAVGRPLVVTVSEAVAGGADTVVFREKDLKAGRRRELADEIADVCSSSATFVVASDYGLAREVGARGVHLAGLDDFDECDDSDDVEASLIVGRSCHTCEELRRSESEGLAYAFLSPTFESSSKPGYGPSIGVDGLRAACRDSGLPTYALGGIAIENAESCRRAGAAGVVCMSSIMRAGDPATAASELAKAVGL